MLREVDRFQPFKYYNDVPIAKIYWGIAVDKVNQDGLFLDWTGQKLEEHLKEMFYNMKVHELPHLLKYEIVSSTISMSATTKTADQYLSFKLLLRGIFEAWHREQMDTEFRLMSSELGYDGENQEDLSDELRDEIRYMARESLKEKRAAELQSMKMRDTEQNPVPVTCDQIPDKANRVKIDYLYGHRKGKRPGWVTYLRKRGIHTVGDAGGWGLSKSDPSKFHSQIIEILNQDKALRNDIDLKESIGAIRYHDVETILENSTSEAFIDKSLDSHDFPNQDADAFATPSSGTPHLKSIVRFDDVPIRDIWQQALIRTSASPSWLETLEANNIKTVGDLGGWKGLDAKFAADMIKKLETELDFGCSKAAHQEIKTLQFDDVKSFLDDTKRIRIYRGNDPIHQVKLQSSEAQKKSTPRKRAKRLTGIEREVRDLEVGPGVTVHIASQSSHAPEATAVENVTATEPEPKRPRRLLATQRSYVPPVYDSSDSEYTPTARKRKRVPDASTTTPVARTPVPASEDHELPERDRTLSFREQHEAIAKWNQMMDDRETRTMEEGIQATFELSQRKPRAMRSSPEL
ncbi:hypothetical protein ABW21_db0200612 [Orbilia brochopaga]|nr:hypothetical protein ABW21_db0200612 [Drechslerella brochopaga]